MKRVRCPKCDAYTTFDETRFEDGMKLVFQCPECGKQFAIRLSRPLKDQSVSKEDTAYSNEWGTIVVLENSFGYRQEFSLKEGDNIIGRRSKGTEVDIAIETSDMSMDRRHCILNVRRVKDGRVVYTLRDAPSLTGTFVGNDLLADRERIIIEDGAVVSIGATTFLLQAMKNDVEKM